MREKLTSRYGDLDLEALDHCHHLHEDMLANMIILINMSMEAMQPPYLLKSMEYLLLEFDLFDALSSLLTKNNECKLTIIEDIA